MTLQSLNFQKFNFVDTLSTATSRTSQHYRSEGFKGDPLQPQYITAL